MVVASAGSQAAALLGERRVRRLGRIALIAWFASISGQRLLVLAGRGEFGFDARLNREAAAAWLAGGNPWSVSLKAPSSRPRPRRFSPLHSSCLCPGGWQAPA